MLLKLVLKNGSELIAAEVRENIESSFNHAPVHSLNMHLKPISNGGKLGVDELMTLFGDPANTQEMTVYKRDHALGEDGLEKFSEWELHEVITGFTILKGVFKDFYSKQLDVILTKG
ncbi:hypothetical protein MKY88_24385 [Lysinibacillus sp. FSL R7-0073]|uniref:Uncharacterized protein n=1 Tax=Lysinibacillus fusiformis TaxID=28031 RepID=A0A1E4QYD6_9BACI|nr:hypothetical protein [Lysinibacillus fusiformis]MBD8523920.1 hypothetical protein [Lysinibacillus fusiformis]MCR8854877.1 hypothetical protein [Lysinibacillus fusiformis]MED4889008.1 hypothetical protein [Lysinibacillus fusiformis]ODV53223.1 hypothetical protein BG258_23255 [Lysinibacillus fusiformis]WKT77140.1 hypothetical protein QYY55_24685 [Lysinibacillus fusiformis]